MVKYAEARLLYDEFERKLLLLKSVACKLELVKEYDGIKGDLDRLSSSILELTK